MKIESNFRESVKNHAVEGGRNTLVSIVVLALFLAVVFAVSKIAIEIAKPYLPIHGLPAPKLELRR